MYFYSSAKKPPPEYRERLMGYCRRPLLVKLQGRAVGDVEEYDPLVPPVGGVDHGDVVNGVDFEWIHRATPCIILYVYTISADPPGRNREGADYLVFPRPENGIYCD